MKSFALFLLVMLSTKALMAQKENNVWLGGIGCGLDFNGGDPVPFLRDDGGLHNIWRTDASVCDSSGNLLFYSNGYRVFNKNFQVMQNGDSLEIGDYEGWGYDMLGAENGAAIVPVPGQPRKYYLFHCDMNVIAVGTLSGALMPTHLFTCLIDMDLDNGLGGVVAGQKDVVVLSNTLMRSGFKLVKHGNGRDYWLIAHEMNSDRYERLLVDPQGIRPYYQSTGYPFLNWNALSYSVLDFSPEATKAAQLSNDSTEVLLYDFDRCSGLFSNPVRFKVSDTLYYADGCAFSPNGRFLYVSAGPWDYIWQFDLTASDIFASRKLVAHYDGALNPDPSNFYELRLASNNKIYVHPYDWSHSLHVINYPDSAGLACGFVENAIQVNPPGETWNGFPNIVDYHLGPSAGSGCDTITSTKALRHSVFNFDVYPSPFTDQLQIIATGVTTKAFVTVKNVLGQTVYQGSLTPVDHTVHQTIGLSKSADGVYFVSLLANGQSYSKAVVKE